MVVDGVFVGRSVVRVLTACDLVTRAGGGGGGVDGDWLFVWSLIARDRVIRLGGCDAAVGVLGAVVVVVVNAGGKDVSIVSSSEFPSGRLFMSNPKLSSIPTSISVSSDLASALSGGGGGLLVRVRVGMLLLVTNLADVLLRGV